MAGGLSRLQKGRAAEWLVAASATLGSGGLIEVFFPATDDDHTDMVLALKGLGPRVLVQVKGIFSLDSRGRANARMTYYDSKVIERPNFWYVIVLIAASQISHAWLVPGTEFNKRAQRTDYAKGGTQLNFQGQLTGHDKWADFAVEPLQLGGRLGDVMQRVANPRPDWLPKLSTESVDRRRSWLRIGGG